MLTGYAVKLKKSLLYFAVGVFTLLGSANIASATIFSSQYNLDQTATAFTAGIVQKLGNGYSGSVGSVTIKSFLHVNNTGDYQITGLQAYSDSGYTTPSWGDWCSPTGSLHYTGGTEFEATVSETYVGCTLNPSLYYAINLANSPNMTFKPLGGSGPYPQMNVGTTVYPIPAGTDTNVYNMFFQVASGAYEPPVTDTTTRIIDFNPQDGEVVDIGGAATGTVPFDLHAYINADDLGNFLTIKVIFRNIDQNTIINGQCGVANSPPFCSIYSFDIFRGVATTSGDFYYASSTVLAKGNYRVEASLDTATTVLGLNLGAFTWFGATSIVQNHQFIVGSSTFIGNVSQNLFEEVDSFFGSLNATSTEVLASMCNPLNSNFGIRECMVFLFVPDSKSLQTTLEDFRDGVLTHVPWGYVTRVYDIMATTSSSTLPSISYTFDPRGPLAGKTFDINTNDMIAGAGTLLSSVRDPVNNHNIRDVLETLVKMVVAIAVIFTIFSDITKSHWHSTEEVRNKNT